MHAALNGVTSCVKFKWGLIFQRGWRTGVWDGQKKKGLTKYPFWRCMHLKNSPVIRVFEGHLKAVILRTY